MHVFLKGGGKRKPKKPQGRVPGWFKSKSQEARAECSSLHLGLKLIDRFPRAHRPVFILGP